MSFNIGGYDTGLNNMQPDNAVKPNTQWCLPIYCRDCGEKLSTYIEHQCRPKEPLTRKVIVEGIYGHYIKYI